MHCCGQDPSHTHIQPQPEAPAAYDLQFPMESAIIDGNTDRKEAFPMPMDGLTLGFAAREINAHIAGGRIDRITQPPLSS